MPGAIRHNGSGRAARYSSTETRAPLRLNTSPPVNSTDPMATLHVVIPVSTAVSSPGPSGRAVPVSHSAENGGPAGSDTRTASWPSASHRASGERAAGSSSGLPSHVDMTGTGPVTAGPPTTGPPTTAALIVAVAARARAVRARSGSEGPGSTSNSMDQLN